MRIYGKNPVIERLRANPASINAITIQRDFKEADYIHKKAKQRGIPVRVVDKSMILKMTRNSNAQGVIADLTDYEYVAYDEMLEYALKKKRVVLFLDELNDPQNLGAIIRSLGCFGHFSLALPTHKSVEVTESVLRVASGGENYVQIAKVGNINKAIRAAKELGFHIVGAVPTDGEPIEEVKFQFPLGLVIGSEQKGIRDIIEKELDQRVSIPMHVNTVTFNAAAATTIVCYEINRQRKQK
ncbi:MAG: RNA methyltransferase [Candidatus Omnitrophica bacterium]|nr:RNA methyltransferase [Candidatus Omnitrophota bacterium]